MNHSPTSRPLDMVALLVPLALSACSGEAPPGQGSSSSTSLLALAAPAQGAAPAGPQQPVYRDFFQDPNQRGKAASLHLAEVRWGRLAEVFDFDAQSGERSPVHSDFVIGAGIASDGVDYELSENLAGQAELTILHRRGSSAFKSALAAAESAMGTVSDATLPPWSLVPRNAALSLRFDDLLDESTLDASTVRIQAGLAPGLPQEVRLLADANHGSVADPDGDGAFEFYSTRVVIDLSLSELELAQSPVLLPLNPLGLPEAVSADVSNAELRIPAQVSPHTGQLVVLTNPIGNALSLQGNGSIDVTSPTLDVTRAFRSGGGFDPSNGFLVDADAPELVAEFSMAITGAVVADPNLEGVYRLSSVAFNDAACAASPQPGDLLRQGSTFALVQDSGTLNGAVLSDLEVRVLAGPAPVVALGSLWTRHVPGVSPEQCFAHYLPLPLVGPNRGVDPHAQVHVRFSEPMDASSLDAFEAFTVASASGSPSAETAVVGSILADASLSGFNFVPATPLRHAQGANETYHVRVGVDAAPRDLAGNPLAAPLASASFQLAPSAPSETSGGLALAFDAADMVGGDGLPEVRGQVTQDLGGARLLPRQVVHFSADADRNQPVPGVMTPFAQGTAAPLSPLGYKLHMLHRYADLGMALEDESLVNVDVEGLAWAPVAGQVIADVFDEFSIRLGHANVLPDEALNPNTLFPMYPMSGLSTTFAQNYADTPQVVHERSKGYTVSPADLFVSGSGTAMLPYPLNRGVAPEDRAYFTWRDTALQAVGGANGSGAPFDQEQAVLGLPGTKTYAPGLVRSIGLPLLTELRCYPSANALGLNVADISLAANSSSRPNFRAFSAGGIDSAGNTVLKDPDTESIATGGFAPGLGNVTQPADNTFYVGSLDLVTRISRAHTVWFDSGLASPTYSPPVVLSDLPEGTEVSVEFRGAVSIQGGLPGSSGDVSSDAAGIDMYGEAAVGSLGTPVFLGGDDTWKSDISQVNGARFLQVRLTFQGNPVSAKIAALRGLGLAWTD